MADHSLTRRHVLVGSIVGLAAAASGAAVAQEGTAASRPAKPLQDPRTKYTQEPFKEQRQQWPALTSKMEPRPDHGETSYHGSGQLAGRKALITSGDIGIGRAVAIAFAREGADVAINYHPDEESDAQEVVKLIVAVGRKAITLPADIRSQAVCEEVVGKAFEQLGGLDLLVNKAAYQQSKTNILEITDEQFDRTFKINVYHVFYFSKAAIPHLPPSASIINIVSVNSDDPGEELIDYAATKATILNLTKGMAKQLAKKGMSQCGSAGSGLDAVAGGRWSVGGADEGVRAGHTAGKGWAAGGVGGGCEF